jgi:hypothetical protein
LEDFCYAQVRSPETNFPFSLYLSRNECLTWGWDFRHGAQGVLDTASNAVLDAEFGMDREEDVVTQILEKGEIQEITVSIFFFRP